MWGVQFRARDAQVRFRLYCQLCSCFFVLNITKEYLISDLGKDLNFTTTQKCLLDVSASYVVLLATPVKGFHKRLENSTRNA